MCWRCDQPEEELHDNHFWTARTTLHQYHVRDYQTHCMEKYLGQFGMKRVDMSKIKQAVASELTVQPMMPPTGFFPFLRVANDDIHNWHVVAYQNNQMLKLIKGERYQQVLSGREDGTH